MPQPEKKPPRVLLMPQDGTMYCNIVIKDQGRHVFALTIPEDVGASGGVVIPHAARERVRWDVSERMDLAETTLEVEGVASYDLSIALVGEDVVDARMTIRNLGDDPLERVWSFNCLAPVGAPRFQDPALERTYFSRDGEPARLADMPRVIGPSETLGVYYHEAVGGGGDLAFVGDFMATNEDRTDDTWFVTLSSTGSGYMAATSPEALFLFNNQALSCLHSAASFGDIPPGESRTVTCRFYLTLEGGLDEFIARFDQDRRGAGAEPAP